MICVAWILQLCLLSGPVMKEQTFVSTQNDTTANNSVCNWTEKGNKRQKQLSTTLFQSSCSLLASPYPALCCEPQLPPPPTLRWHTVMKKMTFFARFRFAADFVFCLWAWFISMFWGLNSRFGNVLLHSATAARFWGSDSTSLDVAVVIRAVCLWHIHLSHGVTHVVHPILARRHALVDAV